MSGISWSQGGIYQAEEGWPGTSLSAHLAMLLPESGLPFSTLTILKSRLLLLTRQLFARLLWVILGYKDLRKSM